MLGKGHPVLLRRVELKTFVDFHRNEAGKGGDLTHDETTIIHFELAEKTARHAKTPISKAFSLYLDGTLNCVDTLNAIITMGHSRIPVYCGNPTNIVGLILVKSLLMVDPDENVLIRRMMIRKIPRSQTKTSSRKNQPAIPSFKKHHRGCSYYILGIKNGPIPEFPSNEELVGLITIEDMVGKFRQPLIELLESGDIDLCFANEDEAKELLRGKQDASPEASLEFLAKYCKWAVVTLGSYGCIARHGKEIVRVPAIGEAKAIDATGAGDLFASGFIYGLIKGLSLEECC
ncbi:LOW QUALITY PROTEIN: Carbohydrate kinase PfkB, partial [Dillenia turbinata]